MLIERQLYLSDGWQHMGESIFAEDVNLVTVFGDTDIFKNEEHYKYLKSYYPNAHILGCSSSGNILDDAISEASMVATAVSFSSATVVLKHIDVENSDDVVSASKKLANMFEKKGLKHIFILADGLAFNGSDIIKAFNEENDIPKSGGLAGDGDRFEQTWVISDDAPKQNLITAVGFYGDSLTIQSGYCSGWTEFGVERMITKSKGNVLYELDNTPALDLYKTYLGEYADGLPQSGMRFPLNIKKDKDAEEVTRTLLAINEEDGSITFAGEVPEGFHAKLMKPDINFLIDGAGEAAQMAKNENLKTALGLTVSCVGRKLVMSQLVEEELEAVSEVLGDNVKLAGFYSYGEIAPVYNDINRCQLHNQTMTLTTIYES